MKYSKQRELIYKAVVENAVHPTADMVYSIVRQQHPNISLGTVYRNLNLLCEQGKLYKICLPNASDRFDARCDNHYHMTCSKCGQLFDIESQTLSGLDEQINHIPGFTVTGYQILIEGICGNCLEDKHHES